MKTNDYLVDFTKVLDRLISEINRLDSKIRLYRRSSNKFGYEFSVKFLISPNYFESLRDYVYEKIEMGGGYFREIANLRRNISREYDFILKNIQREIVRIERFEEAELNRIVYKRIYEAKFDYEMKLMDSFDTDSSFMDKFVGFAKYKKLMMKNHELKGKLVQKEYDREKNNKKNVNELINMIENSNVKTGELLCMKEELIESFMIGKDSIKRADDFSWKKVDIMPHGVFEKKQHFKILNEVIINENKALVQKLNEEEEKVIQVSKEKLNLRNLNSKLNKILNAKLLFDN